MSFSVSSISSDPLKVDGYELVEEIGRGSYAKVFKAIDTTTKEVVAIKCVEKRQLSSAGEDNIVREIQLMKNILHHQYILEMKHFLWDQKYIYIVLEFCDGGDLSKFIRKRQKLPEGVCRRFMQQLALGLQFLWSKNICHFDLKPSNLLLVTKPILSLKIADFGFANFLSKEALVGTIRGTPLYMAPEVLLHQNFNEKNDLWSVGIIMYECLLGKPPFATSSCKQLMIDIKNQLPIEIRPGSLSPNCEDLLRRLLKYSHVKRITYEEFFVHPFLDLDHFPNEEHYFKAVKLAREAVILDNNREYLDAFNKYCESLSYLIPFLTEVDIVKREQIHMKILEYSKRAEALKVILFKAKDAFVTQPGYQRSVLEEANSKIILENSGRFDVREFKTMCSTTPKMLDGIDIGYAAQMYLYEGKYEIALEKFKASFSVLIPLLSVEPDGIRKKILSKQLDEWMKQAESVQSLIDASAKNVFDLQKDVCSIQ